MAITLKAGNDLHLLAKGLAMRQPAELDPLQPEVVVVPGTGIRYWLEREIALQRGICANIEFPTARSFIHKLMTDVLGVECASEDTKGAMTWRILTALSDGADDPLLEIPAGYIRDKPPLAAMQLAARIADLFDQYLTYRPEWIAGWDAGRPIDRIRGRAAEHEHWQAALWQRMRMPGSIHRATHYRQLVERLQQQPVATLPPLVHVFGTHTLPPVFLQVLKALGCHHDVIISICQPTPHYWGDHPSSAALRDLFANGQRLRTDALSDGEDLPGANELLAAWGGQGRDLFNLLIDCDLFSSESDDNSLFREPPPTSLLGTIQHAVYHLQPVPQRTFDPLKDASLRVHCCHHPLREVQVLQDAVLGYFAEIPGLQPQDILVLTPDINAYAPLIDAVFGAAEPAIPYAIADQSLRRESRIVDTFFACLEAVGGRFEVPTIFALFQSPPFRTRFHWDDDGLDVIRMWLSETATAWGRDAAHRASENLPAYGAYSWQQLFHRLFLGFAVLPEHSDWQGHETPYPAVEGADATLIGNLNDAVHMLRELYQQTATPMPASMWAATLERYLVEPLFGEDKEHPLEVRALRTSLASLAQQTEGMDVAVDLQAVTAYLQSTTADSIHSPAFPARGITFANLTPMRAIPHRVVAILGMNERSFPRQSRPPGFSLMHLDGLRRTGDRSAYQSDRYLFLETLLSARDALHISYCGLSARDDTQHPPAIPVDELLRAAMPLIDEHLSTGTEAHPLTVLHRLHDHARDYFADEGDPRLRSFSATAFRTANALSSTPTATPSKTLELPCPFTDEAVVELPLETLAGCLTNPARHFAKHCLGAYLPEEAASLPADEPLTANNLHRYRIIQSVIASGFTGSEPLPPEAVALPPEPYGSNVYKEWIQQGSEIHQQLSSSYPQFGNTPQTQHIALELNVDGIAFRLTATADQIYDRQRLQFRPGSSIAPKDRIHAWVLHLALCCSNSVDTTTVICADIAKPLQLQSLPSDDAHAALTACLRFYTSCNCAPQPFEWATAEALVKSAGDQATARAAWSNRYQTFNNPADDPWWKLCWDRRSPLDADLIDVFSRHAEALINPYLIATTTNA